MFAYKLFSSVGLKWCPKANREQVGFWSMNPPNSFNAKINQFKLFRNSQQHINNPYCKVNSPWDTAHGFLEFRDKFWAHVHAVPSSHPLWLTAGFFPAPQARFDILLAHPAPPALLEALPWNCILSHQQRPVKQPFAGFVRLDMKKFLQWGWHWHRLGMRQWMSHPWKQLRSGWTGLWPVWSGWNVPAHCREVGQDII